MLQLRGFVGTSDKVKVAQFHPVQPWIAFADKSDMVKVWDWSTQQVLHDLQLGGADEEAMMESAINRAGERDTAFATNPSAASYMPSRSATGKVRQVAFLDNEVAYWQVASQQLMVNGSASPAPRATNVHALDGTRFLVIVCDAKVLLHDLSSKKSFEIGRQLLDGKTPTCIAFLFKGGTCAPGGVPAPDAMMSSPVLAIGCSDGFVRLIHLATLRPLGRLPGSHKGSISALATMPMRAPADGSSNAPISDWLIGGDTTGALYLWDPFAKPMGSAEREVPPRVSLTGHEKEVWSICVTPGPEDAVVTSPRVFTASADHRVACWDVPSFKELWRIKLDSKTPATSLSYSHRYFNLSGAHALLLTTNNSMVMAMFTLAAQPVDKALRPCANVAGLVPPGTKKVPKAYIVAVSPLRPNLAAVGTNTGMAFMTFDRMYALPVAAVPLKDLAAAHVSPNRSLVAEAANCTYVAHMGDSIWHVTCAAADKDVGGKPILSPSVISRERIASCAGQSGRAILGSSYNGSYASVCWPASRTFAVYYRTLSGEWQQVDSGLGVDLAWHSHKDMFAVLEEPPTSMVQPMKTKSKGLLGGGKKEPDQAALKAAMEAAAAAAAAHTCVRIKALDGMATDVVCSQVALLGDVPVGVHGGPLLGIAYRRLMVSGSQLSGEEASPVMQFFSWDGTHKVGPELPEPSFVSWDPTLKLVALAYLRQVHVFRAQPMFESVGTLAVASATSAVWSVRQLYIATPTSVLLAFVSAPESTVGALMDLGGPSGPEECNMQLVTLASLSGTTATSSLRSASSAADASLPGADARPPGPMALIGPREGNLWMVNCYGQPMLVPLSHPGLRARCLVAMGDLQGAVQVAQLGLSHAQHDALAAFMRTTGQAAGAHVALLGLPGLSVEMEARLCMAIGQWRRALACCTALMMGCEDRSHLASSEAFAKRTGAAGEALGWGMDAGMGMASGIPGMLQTRTAGSSFGGLLSGQGFPSVGGAAPGAARASDWSFGGMFEAYAPPPKDDEEEEAEASTADAAGGKAAGSKAKAKEGTPPNWAAPLQPGWSFGRPPATASSTTLAAAPASARPSVAGGASAAKGVSAGGAWGNGSASSSKLALSAAQEAAKAVVVTALAPTPAAIALTIRLVEESQLAGISDVTRGAVTLLLRHRGVLSPPQLARLAAKMAEAGMAKEVDALVDAGVASGSHQGQAVGFVAAALTGDLERLQGALARSGTAALAALQANTYRLPSAKTAEGEWNGSLQGAGLGMAAHATKSYAYFAVTPF